ASHGLNRIGPLNGLAVKRCSREGGGGIPTRDACGLGLEVQHEVGLAIAIGILAVASSVRFRRPVGAKLHTEGVDSGGVKGVSGDDSHGDDAVTLGVDAVGEA